MGKRPRGGATSGQSNFSSPSTAKCFIGGLSQMTDSEKLVAYFETKYAPYKVRISVQPSPFPRARAFVLLLVFCRVTTLPDRRSRCVR